MAYSVSPEATGKTKNSTRRRQRAHSAQLQIPFRATGKAVQPGKGEGSSGALGKDKQKAVLRQRDQNIVVNEGDSESDNDPDDLDIRHQQKHLQPPKPEVKAGTSAERNEARPPQRRAGRDAVARLVGSLPSVPPRPLFAARALPYKIERYKPHQAKNVKAPVILSDTDDEDELPAEKPPAKRINAAVALPETDDDDEDMASPAPTKDKEPAAPKANKAPFKRARVDTDSSDTDEASPPPAKKATIGAGREDALKDNATPAFEDEDEDDDDDDDDDDIYSLLVKKPAALSPEDNNTTANKHVSLDSDSDDEPLPARKTQPALQEAVVESDEDVNDDEPAPMPMAEMATVNDQFFVRYDSDEEEAHPAPKDKAASAHAVQAKELTIEKQAVPLGEMGNEVLAALLQRTAAHAKDQPAEKAPPQYNTAGFDALNRLDFLAHQSLHKSSSAAPAAAAAKEQRAPDRRSRRAFNSSAFADPDKTLIDRGPRTTMYGVQWPIGPSNKASAPGPSGANRPAAAPAARRPRSDMIARLCAVYEPEGMAAGSSGSSAAASKAAAAQAWKR